MKILLFDRAEDYRPSRIIELSPFADRTTQYWHVFVPGVGPGQLYGLQASGPYFPPAGHRYDPEKLLLDPYARSIAVGTNYSREAAAKPGENAGSAMKSVVVDPSAYDWEGDLPLQRSFRNTVIYEMHVRGFTQHPNSGVSSGKHGTYAGVIDKIPYLLDLGITAVELMPVFQFDVQDCPAGLTNYWGYSPVSFFAPHLQYSSSSDPLAALNEFRDMVKALHRAGIEVILDVVYNHTAEGGETGPTLSLKGLENSFYYLLEQDRSRYVNYSGTGNTLNANHSIVRRLILDSLRYWVREMHVDGFRFDLASILSRNESGEPVANAPTLWDIDSDPVLAGAKLMAEPWDAAGLYQLGTFLGDEWREWNGRFRDDVRSFMRGDRDTAWNFHQRLLGSPDLYSGSRGSPGQAIHFVACHDGFTLNDLVSYNEKHNEANLELNRDGSSGNFSTNFGIEGPSDDAAVERARLQQIKNLLTVTMLSAGTPLLLMGDEARRTQKGNNNAYCQDNEISWFDWSLCDRHAELRRFVRLLIRFRMLYLERSEEMPGSGGLFSQARFEWHGTELGRPDWSSDSHTAACTISQTGGSPTLHLIVNAYKEPLSFQLPPAATDLGMRWLRLIDTALPSPDDIAAEKDALVAVEGNYWAASHSVVVLMLASE